MNLKHTVVLLVALSPLAAQAGARGEVARDLDDARAQVHAELARERAKLESDNLSLGDSLHFGKEGRQEAALRRNLPTGEITPDGDFLVDGKPVAIDAAQRRQLRAYRAQVITLANTGIDAGERAAMLAIDATDVSLFRMFVGAMTGSLERRVKATVAREIQPAVLRICRSLPQLRVSQQALAASLPEFRPYATLEEKDSTECEREVRNELASL